jgi:hypothetical protein
MSAKCDRVMAVPVIVDRSTLPKPQGRYPGVDGLGPRPLAAIQAAQS